MEHSFRLQTYEWTRHAEFKMRQYGLSEHRVKRVIRHPYRTEEGVLEGAIAVMQPSSIRRDEKGEKTWGSEIWVMYLISKKKKDGEERKFGGGKALKIVTAWRYPGVSSRRDPIPEDVLMEVQSLL